MGRQGGRHQGRQGVPLSPGIVSILGIILLTGIAGIVTMVGLCTVQVAPTHSLKGTWFQPLKLTCDILVSSVCWHMQLVPLRRGGAHAGL
jgi:hypothetical protein